MQYNNKKLLIVKLKDRECFDVKNYEWRIIINQLIKLITIIWILFSDSRKCIEFIESNYKRLENMELSEIHLTWKSTSHFTYVI